MAIEFIESFDVGSTNTSWTAAKWTSISTGFFANAVGRYGTGLALSPWEGTLIIDSTKASCPIYPQQSRTVGFAFAVSAWASGPIVAFTDVGTTQVDVRLNTSGNLLITRNGTTLATSTQVFPQSVTWGYIEFMATIDGSNGMYELWINGVRWLQATGVNTQSTNNKTCNGVQFTANAASRDFCLDDVYIKNTAIPGDIYGECRIFGQTPNANGLTDQWLPNAAGSNFAKVNELIPDSDSTYVGSNVPGVIDLYTVAPINPNGNILAVQEMVTARKDSSGPVAICDETNSGGISRDGVNGWSLTSNYQMFRAIYENDPNTGLAWTTTNLNNAQFGQRIIPAAFTFDPTAITDSVSLVRF